MKQIIAEIKDILFAMWFGGCLGRVPICGRPSKCKRFLEEDWHVVGCCHLSGL